MRLRLVFRKQMKPVPALPGRDSEEAMHENFLPNRFSRAHTGVHGFHPTSVAPTSSPWLLTKKQVLDLYTGPGILRPPSPPFLFCRSARTFCWLTSHFAWKHNISFFSCTMYCLLFLIWYTTCNTSLVALQDKNKEILFMLCKSLEIYKRFF